MDLIAKLLLKISIKELKIHIVHFVNLFICPKRSWKNAISNRKNVKEFVVNYIAYLFFIILLIIREPTLTVKLILFDISTTFFPFLILIVPFKLLTKIYNKRLKWTSFFKLLLVIKIQLSIIVMVPCFFFNLTQNETYFIIINNIIWIGWLLDILLLPLLINLKFSQRIIWIIANYMMLNLCFLFISRSGTLLNWGKAVDYITETYVKENKRLSYLKGNTFYKNYKPISPDNEYTMFQLKTDDFIINDSIYLLLVRKTKCNDSISILGTQYLSGELSWLIASSLIDGMKESKLNIDSIKNYDSTYIPLKGISLKKVDSIKNVFNQKFLTNLEYIKILMDSATFKSNQDYFKKLYIYLLSYQYNHININKIKEIIDKNQINESISLGDSVYFYIYHLDPEYMPIFRHEIMKTEDLFIRRHLFSDLTMRIVLFPCRLFGKLLPKKKMG